VENDDTYKVFAEAPDSSSDLSSSQFAEMIKLFQGSDEPKRNDEKKKGKKKKGKKKHKKALDHFLKKKSKKKSKKKAKKKRAEECKYLLIEKVVDTTLDTASYAAKRYVAYKWPVPNNK
jgi:hypothetical protein